MAPKLRVIEATAEGPPRPRGRHGMALLRSIMDEYQISDSGGIELLTLACQALDRAEQLGDLIDHAGVGSISESGLARSNPMVKDQLACRAFVVKTLER